MECPHAALAVPEFGLGKHSAGNTGRCEKLSPQRVGSNPSLSRQQPARLRSASDCCPAARTLAPAARAAISAAVPAEGRPLHPGISILYQPVQNGLLFARLLP